MNGKEHFDLTDEGNIEKYLRVDVKKKSNGSIELTQERLVGRIMKAVGLEPKLTGLKTTPMSTPLLHKNH